MWLEQRQQCPAGFHTLPWLTALMEIYGPVGMRGGQFYPGGVYSYRSTNLIELKQIKTR